MTAPRTRAGLEDLRILVVDDDPASIHVIRRALRAYSNLCFAINGRDALARVSESKPDLILLDAEMPDKNGLEVCRELKANTATDDIPIIFVTAHDDIEFEARALRLGAADFIGKPVSPPLVELRVRLHLQLKQQLDALRRLATTDGLTTLWNRVAFDIAIDVELRRSLRSHLALSLLLVDIDHFKAYNDTYGHAAGDDCLKRVASIIGSAARRPADIAARFGGEEFALLLPETTAAGAHEVACALVRAVADARIPHAGSRVAEQVTVSVGVASQCEPLSPQESATFTPSSRGLLECADQALYAAKHQGRNRAVSLPPCASTKPAGHEGAS